MNVSSMMTQTPRAVPKVGCPSMMSDWALSAGTPGTSIRTEATIATLTVALPARLAPTQAKIDDRKATLAAITKTFTRWRSMS